jgi:hypothetical protein
MRPCFGWRKGHWGAGVVFDRSLQVVFSESDGVVANLCHQFPNESIIWLCLARVADPTSRRHVAL